MNTAGSTSLVGDGRCVRVACNSGRLLVVGNGVDVAVERNDGEVRVVGNHGRVRVARNRGVVQYVGNAGCVRARGGRVDYAGCDGHVERDAEPAPCPCADAAARAPQPQPQLPHGTPCEEPLLYVAHRPDARSEFRQVRLRPNTSATAVNINVSSAAECEEWRSKFTKGFWIAT